MNQKEHQQQYAINYLSKAIPFLYFQINKNDMVVDHIRGEGLFISYKLKKWKGKSFFDLCPEAIIGELVSLIHTSRAQQKIIKKEFFLPWDERISYHEYTFIPIQDEQVIIYILYEELVKRMELGSLYQLKYSGLFDICPEYICLIDYKTGKIVEVNKAAQDFYEISNDNINLISIYDIMLKDYHELIANIHTELLHTKTIKDLIVEIRTYETGRHYPVEVRCAAVYDNEKISHVFCVMKDLEQRTKINEMKEIFVENMRLLNEVVEFEKVRTEFFSNISHEFKTPINVILGALKLMEMSVSKIEDNNTKLKLDNLHNSMKINCYRLLRLVSNLLDLTRIESGYIKVNLINCNIIELVRDITFSINEYAIEKGLELEFESKTKNHIIACDPEKLERIMLNLLSNAIKFTSRGDKITVSAELVKDEIILSVQDTGIGIKEEDQQVIFERFRQVNKSFSRNSEGTGIGLSLVKSLVEMHNGRIWVKSTYGKGTSFFIGLPDKRTNETTSYYNGIESINIGDRVVMEFSDIYM